MKRLTIIIIGLLFAINCPAATHYVVTNGTPGVTSADPYTSWATAGTNIIDVVNAAMTYGETRVVLVSNGTYYLTNQVVVSNALTIQSVNGREVTIVDGNYPNYTNRCFCLNHSSAVISGLTITNGYAPTTDPYAKGGGGIYSIGIVQDCLIVGCYADINNHFVGGGGIRSRNGTVKNCSIIRNSAVTVGTYYTTSGGGGIHAQDSVVTNCFIAWNTVTNLLSGGGITVYRGSVYNCTIISNSALSFTGGGVHILENSTFANNLVIGNEAPFAGGGFYMRSSDANCIIRNCLIRNNIATPVSSGGKGGGIYFDSCCASIQNSTIVSNSGYYCGGISIIYTGADNINKTINCIIYYNKTLFGPPDLFDQSGGVNQTSVCFSCVAPGSGFTIAGVVTNEPQFVNKDNYDFHLSRGSLCINSGTNQAWMTGAVDLDGHSRIDRFSDIVDMGCYEYLSQGFMFSVP